MCAVNILIFRYIILKDQKEKFNNRKPKRIEWSVAERSAAQCAKQHSITHSLDINTHTHGPYNRSLIHIYSHLLGRCARADSSRCLLHTFMEIDLLFTSICTLYKLNDERRKCGALIIYELSHSLTFYNASEACSITNANFCFPFSHALTCMALDLAGILDSVVMP